MMEMITQALLTSCTCSCRDPDITFFDQMSQPVVMYRSVFLFLITTRHIELAPRRRTCVWFGVSPSRVKPAAFDLFLGGCIAAYLGIVYKAIQVCSCNLCQRPDKACFCATSSSPMFSSEVLIDAPFLSSALFVPYSRILSLFTQSSRRQRNPNTSKWRLTARSTGCKATPLVRLCMHGSLFITWEKKPVIIYNSLYLMDGLK